MKKIVLLGCGGHAKSIIDSIEGRREFQIVGFIDHELNSHYGYRDYQIIGTDDDLELLCQEGVKYAFICVGNMGDTSLRKYLEEAVSRAGMRLATIIDNTAVIASDAIIGQGTYIGKNAIVNSQAHIGNMCIINSGAIVEHECMIGNHVHVAVAGVVCGRVVVGDDVLIGANTTVVQKVTIGKKAIIGAGMLITTDIGESSKITVRTESNRR